MGGRDSGALRSGYVRRYLPDVPALVVGRSYLWHRIDRALRTGRLVFRAGLFPHGRRGAARLLAGGTAETSVNGRGRSSLTRRPGRAKLRIKRQPAASEQRLPGDVGRFVG